MPSQIDLWLGILGFLALLELSASVRIAPAYSWTRSLIALMTLLAVTVACFFNIKVIGLACAISIQLAFMLIPGAMLSRIGARLTMLDVESARNLLKPLKLLYWGKPFEFIKDRVDALGLYIARDQARADQLMLSWMHAGTPAPVVEQAQATRLNGRIVMADWNGTIELFEELKESNSAPRAMNIWVSRAYAELRQIDKATEFLSQSGIHESGSAPGALAISFLPYFALSGAKDKVSVLLEELSKGGSHFPEFARTYWLGRCCAVRAEYKEARQNYERALSLMPDSANVAVWRARVTKQMDNLETLESERLQHGEDQQSTGTDRLDSEANERNIEKIWGLYQQAKYSQQITSPTIRSKTVVLLAAIPAAIYACKKILVTQANAQSEYFQSLGMSSIEPVIAYMRWADLDAKRVFAGEYWRLVSYMFDHKDEAHILLNTFGLLWFGRLTQNIFGTAGLITIFFASGIGGAIANCIFEPSTIVIGDSGGVNGLFGAAGIGIYRLRNYLPVKVRKTQISWLVALAIGGVLIDKLMPQVAALVHFGGILTGILLGTLLPVRKPQNEVQVS